MGSTLCSKPLLRHLLTSISTDELLGGDAAVELIASAWAKGGSYRIRSVQTQMPGVFLEGSEAFNIAFVAMAGRA